MTPRAFGSSLYQTFTTYDTYRLLAIVAFILMLSNCMRESGALEDVMGSVRHMATDNRFIMGLLPALIGFLPVPGGALFSAPMIEKLSDEAELTPEFRTFINYWFRHVWEYSYPLYPGLLLVATILHLQIERLITFQFPLSIVAIISGTIFGLSQVRRIPQKVIGSEYWSHFWRFLKGFWPVLLIVLGIFIIPWQLILPHVLPKEWLSHYKIENFDPLMLTLPVTVFLFGITRLGVKRFFRTAFVNLNYQLPLIVLTVLIFKDVIGNSGAVDSLGRTFQQWGIPPIVLLLVLPAIMGYLTGITHSYVSVAFPLLMPFFGNPIDLAAVQLAYMAGFVGVILSPAHLCLILSADYYKADMNKVFRMIFAPVGLVLAVSIGIYLWHHH